MRLAGIATFLLCGFGPAQCTTIVVVRTPVDVSMAADSRQTLIDANGNETPRDACKIYSVGNEFIGISGIAGDPKTRFDPSAIVFDAIRDKPTFAEKMTAIVDAMIPRLRAEVLARPDQLKNLTDPDIGGMGIVLIGMQNGEPYVVGNSFTVSVNSQGSMSVVPGKGQKCPGADCPAGFLAGRLGVAAAIDRLLATRPTITDSADFARQLVQLEIDDPTTKGVGAPIDVVRVSRKGTEWIQRKQGCPIRVNGAERQTTAPHGLPIAIPVPRTVPRACFGWRISSWRT
jgi:hypothetical protein